MRDELIRKPKLSPPSHAGSPRLYVLPSCCDQLARAAGRQLRLCSSRMTFSGSGPSVRPSPLIIPPPSIWAKCAGWARRAISRILPLRG